MPPSPSPSSPSPWLTRSADPPPPSKSSLPPENVFSIQIGTELFRLSGASIASDAPSYFSAFFEDQLRQNPDPAALRTLYIDRDPVTFKEIARHLQGYHVRPRDGYEFVKLFADAQFYSLPRLNSQLFESEIFIQIGDRNFQIPRDIFSSPGDSPNFFSLGFGAFFASPAEVFPGLDRKGLLRPPAIVPTSVPNRSGDVFAQLLHLLRGYPLEIRSEAHRNELLRDCSYFHLRGLEQKLIPHEISFNPVRDCEEILIRLQDVRRSGLQVTSPLNGGDCWAAYARPYVDEKPYEMILEIGSESTVIDARNWRAHFLDTTQARVSTLLQIIAGKAAPSAEPAQQVKSESTGSSGGSGVSISIDEDTDLTLDGRVSRYPDVLEEINDPGHDTANPPAKRRRLDGGSSESPRWVVRNGHWRIRIRPGSGITLVAVKLDVYTEQRMRNKSRGFLAS